jgi:hypothetical protein
MDSVVQRFGHDVIGNGGFDGALVGQDAAFKHPFTQPKSPYLEVFGTGAKLFSSFSPST